MSARIRTVVAIAMTVVIAASPALASHGGKHPTFKTSSVYFRCAGPTPAQNVNRYSAVVPLLGLGSVYSGWNATAPSGSLQSGKGCLMAEPGYISNETYDVAFRGSFTGNLQSVTVRIHQALLGSARPTLAETLRLGGSIDGSPIFPVGSLPAQGRKVTVTPVGTTHGTVQLFEFTITNLGYAEEVLDEAGNVIDVRTGGIAKEHGDGTIEHELTLLIGVHGESVPDSSSANSGGWVWDSTETPGGLTFNPSSPEQVTVAADLPTPQGP
jgi:hypothetical protein